MVSSRTEATLPRNLELDQRKAERRKTDDARCTMRYLHVASERVLPPIRSKQSGDDNKQHCCAVEGCSTVVDVRSALETAVNFVTSLREWKASERGERKWRETSDFLLYSAVLWPNVAENLTSCGCIRRSAIINRRVGKHFFSSNVVTTVYWLYCMSKKWGVPSTNEQQCMQ